MVTLHQRAAKDGKSVWAILVSGGECALEIRRIANLRPQERYTQRVRRGREHFLELERVARVLRLEKDGDADNFRHRFFEQLQTLAAEMPSDVGKTGDVTARTGKAFDQACLDRIEPATCL